MTTAVFGLSWAQPSFHPTVPHVSEGFEGHRAAHTPEELCHRDAQAILAGVNCENHSAKYIIRIYNEMFV